jgi:hypothetical protein
MITSKQALERYGNADNEAGMILWWVPAEFTISVIPRRIYCNKDLVKPLYDAFTNLIHRGFLQELKTWDGCFNIRKKHAGTSPSLHSWGLAIDINAGWNPYGKAPTLSEGFVQCFLDAGFDWGGYWKILDGMHFQLKELP